MYLQNFRTTNLDSSISRIKLQTLISVVKLIGRKSWTNEDILEAEPNRGEERVGRRLLLLEERPVGHHIGLILYGLQDGLWLRYLVRPGNGELRLRLLHVEARQLLLR